jgi:hypothetical protein
VTTILFVHGIGTRRASFDAFFGIIKQNLLARKPDVTIAPCYWGEPYGAELYAHGASIPDYAQTRDFELTTTEDYQIALWEQLYRDPLFEFRLQAIKAQDAESSLAGSPPSDPLSSFTISSTLGTLLEQARIVDEFVQGQKVIQSSEPYQTALHATFQDANAYPAITARALVAQAIVLSEQNMPYAPIAYDAPMRDHIVQQVGNDLTESASQRSFTTWVGEQVFQLALDLGVMDAVQRKRGALTDFVYPQAGDVLLYQGRGEKIRGYIRECIEQASPPVVLLAHSLGGVACVDLLVEQALPQVPLLVTVGSQAPFFYEINALHSLPWQQALPAHFPASWLNIYDLHDFMSYIGAKLFPSVIKDVQVDSKQPFPNAHGAYFSNPQTWDAIIPLLPAF